ncbi:MAG: HAMP domain-containing protein [Oscillospiraceae bacterium]
MRKKIVSFIIILLAYSIAGAALLIGTGNFGYDFSDTTDDEIKYSFALDRAGDIYYAADTDGEKYLVSVDSSGKKLFEKKLDSSIFGDVFYIDSIYVEHDKNIYVSVYEYDYDTGIITDVSVHRFYEDGSYAERLFGADVNVYPNSRSSIISAFTEDDLGVYFALLNEGKAELFCSRKNNSEPIEKVGEYTVDVPVYGFSAVSSRNIAVGTKDGVIVYTPDGQRFLHDISGAVFDRFWNGINSTYVMDSVSGEIYMISQDLSMASVLSGKKIINPEDGLSVSDMDDVALSITGNILGTVRGENVHIYSGSFSLMSEVYVDSTDMSGMINAILADIALTAAVILLTILTWDFYCSILKMRLSIMLRQSLLIIMAIVVQLYTLSYFVIVPRVEDIIMENYMHEAELVANTFEASVYGAVSNGEKADYEAYSRFIEEYGTAAANDKMESEYVQTARKSSVNLLENRSGKLVIIASGELYPFGYPADMLLYDYDLTEAAKNMEGSEKFIISTRPDGQRLYLLRRISLPMTSNDTYIFVGSEINELSNASNGIRQLLSMYVIFGGAFLAGLFMIIENITARSVRKLKRSVDRIAGGEYTAPIDIKSGDEIEELSVSVQDLAHHIIDKTTSLERLNNSYYRFVPQSFLANLGETRIEKVGKSLHAKKHMAVLFLRFDFSQLLSGMEAQDIFSNINSVYENIMPVIDSYGGTGYNFLFNGLSAIFPESTESALQAAIRIRETINAYNDVQRSNNKRTAEVRIVISEGEVLLGFIGDDRRMEPTVVSPAINESEEIEKILSDSGLYIVCTESAFRSLPKDKYRNRCIGSFVTAEGTQVLYDLFDSDPYSMIKLKEQFIMKFELGVKLFNKQDFVNARNVFMDIAKYAADDGVSRNYLYISEHNISAEKKQLTYTVYSDGGQES